MQKYSVLGCILMATSAITAAFTSNPPGKTSSAVAPFFDGHMTLSTFMSLGSYDITCREILEFELEWMIPNCSWTETRFFDYDYLSSTSRPGLDDSVSLRNVQQTGSYTTHPSQEDDIL